MIGRDEFREARDQAAADSHGAAHAAARDAHVTDEVGPSVRAPDEVACPQRTADRGHPVLGAAPGRVMVAGSVAAMKFAILAVIAAGCASRTRPAAVPDGGLPDFAAARWVPARPLYVLASRSLDDAQRAARDAIDLLTPFPVGDVVGVSSGLFGVDVLHAEPLAAIGVDVRGSWALFGEPDPTLVVHLAAPAQMTAFLDHQRERGLVTRSVRVDGSEVVSAALLIGVTVSWAIDGEWMWVHVALPGTSDDAGRWFTASHGRHTADWVASWTWAQQAAGAAAGLVGVLDGHGAVAGVLGRVRDAAGCARLAGSIGRVAVAVQGDDRHAAARLAIEVGSTEQLRAMLLPAPGGWPAIASGAPIAAQWNLDLVAARPYVEPCLALAGVPVTQLDQTGVRAARGVLLTFDPDALSGSGAVALDVASPAYFEQQLDRIPLRKHLEHETRFGPYRGATIDIPFGPTIEYALDGGPGRGHGVALAALGEGLLARLVAPAAHPAPTPIAEIAVTPPAMSAQAWAAVFELLDGEKPGGSPDRALQLVIAHLRAWRDGRLTVSAEGSEIVITASGNRR